MTTSIGRFALASALALSLSLTAAHAQTTPAPLPLLTTVEQKLAEGPAGSRFGLLVTTLDGEILLSIAPDQRFIPASNTKMFTTAIAYAELPLLQRTAKGTGVRLETGADGTLAPTTPPTIAPRRLPTRSPRRRATSATSSATTAGSPMSAGARG